MAGLVTLIFVGLVQLAVVLHVRSTVISCAAEGAHYGALAGSSPAAGAARARELIIADLSARYAEDVSAGLETTLGLQTVVVRVRAPLPVVGLLGLGHSVEVEGHALLEAG